MNQEYTNLSESYAKISKEVYKSNLASDALLKYDDLLKTDYSSASWERYEMQITALREAYAKIHTVFIPTKSNESRAQEFVDAYFKKLAASSDTAYQNLISTELFHALKNLCSNAKAVEISDGLEIKYNLLQDAVKNGQDVLNNKDALVAEFEEAIEDVQNALENFSLAEDHLEKEQAKVVKQDKAASRWIVIFSVFSFFASVLCAGFLSRRQFGRIDWTK
jgi:paraquat-inducible protein B